MERINHKGKKILYRAGMIPYVVEGNEVKMLFMKPSDTMYGGDSFQMCKGVIEDFEDTRSAAIREAEEELGLTKDNTMCVMELGVFLGRTTVFICKVKNKEDFIEPHYETDEVKWMSCQEFVREGRELHREIVQLAEQVIQKNEDLD